VELKDPDMAKAVEDKKRMEMIFSRQQQEWLMASWLEEEKRKAKIEIFEENLK
jgi:hypothetical protein